MIKPKTSPDTKPSSTANYGDSFLIEHAEKDLVFIIKVYIIEIKEAEDVKLIKWPNRPQTSKYFQTKYKYTKESDYYSSPKLLKPNWSSQQCQYSILAQRFSDTQV